MSEAPDLLPLQELGDLVSTEAALPFNLVDGQGRLLLARGHNVQDPRQLQALIDRGACAGRADVLAERAVRAKGGGAAGARSGRKLTWFDHWEHHVWDIDTTLRRMGREPSAAQLDELVSQQLALVAAQPDAALFTLIRQDDRRFALYALTHARWSAAVIQLSAVQLGWDECPHPARGGGGADDERVDHGTAGAHVPSSPTHPPSDSSSRFAPIRCARPRCCGSVAVRRRASA